MLTLTVCTGNICRSPQAEQLLRLGLATSLNNNDSNLEFASAGIKALTGQPMPAAAAQLSTSYGADPTGHRGQQITADLIQSAGLILALTREHRANVVRLVPAASRRTFTLIEFARIIEDAPESNGSRFGKPIPLPELVQIAAARRGYQFEPDPSKDDVVDPYRGSDSLYRKSFEQIARPVELIARLVHGR